MTVSVQEFADTLQTHMEMTGDTSFVEELKCNALNAVLSGKGTIGGLTSSGVNGKTFQRSIDLNPAQVLDACQRALKAYAGDDSTVGSTYADFREIHR